MGRIRDTAFSKLRDYEILVFQSLGDVKKLKEIRNKIWRITVGKDSKAKFLKNMLLESINNKLNEKRK